MHAILRSAREHQAGKRTEWDGLAESPRYKFRNESLIEWLEIIPEEKRKLKSTISGDERRRRDHERDEKRSRDPSCPYSLTAWNRNSANFALKLSEKSHERANLLAIRRLMAM